MAEPRLVTDAKARLDELARRAGLAGVSRQALLAGAAVLVLIVGVGLWRWWPFGGGSSGDAAPQGLRVEESSPARPEGSPATPRASENSASVCVHVVGAVPRPGLYTVPAGARVADAVAAAGGLLGNAEERVINLARPVVDGEQIVVLTKDEVASGLGAAGTGMPASSPGAQPGGAIDINSADAATLDQLPGIGPSTAAKIVADREANGRFAAPEELGRVSGIGPKKLDALLDLIVAR